MDDKKYKFVYRQIDGCRSGGWYLEISTPEQLLDYHQVTDTRWGNVVLKYLNSKECGNGTEHLDTLSLAVVLSAENRKQSIIEGVLHFKQRVIIDQLDWLHKEGKIFINPKGGYCFPDKRTQTIQHVYRDKLLFPCFTENDIRIKRFPMGEHFYAYIGDVELHDGDIRKWNSREEARAFAKQYVEN